MFKRSVVLLSFMILNAQDQPQEQQEEKQQGVEQQVEEQKEEEQQGEEQQVEKQQEEQEKGTVVKYFPTDIQRSEILNSEILEKDVKGKAHFKSTYSGQGKLLNVEFVPGKKKGREKLSGLKLYFGYWDIEKRDLGDGLTKDQLDGRNYYELTFNSKGRIKNVTFIGKNKRSLWSYQLKWNKAGTRSKYSVEFHVREPLTLFDEFLFADELSEMRQGWIAEIEEREDNRPHTVTVKDKLEQVYYYYTLQYMDGGKKSRSKEIIVSEYFRDDSTKVGKHKLFYNRKDFLHKAEYYNAEDNLKYTNSFDYSNAPREILLTVNNKKGKLLEKRIIPFSNKYKRRLGPPKDKTGLADILEFIENSGEENLENLAQLIGAKFNVTADIEGQALVSGEKPPTKEELLEKMLAKIPIKKKGPTRAEKFVLGFYLGNKIVSGDYLSADNVLEIGLDIKFPFLINLFWFSITPSLSVGQVSFHGDDNSTVSWVALESADFIPLKLPLIVHGGLGTVGPGFGIKGGIKIKFKLGVDVTLGTSAVVVNDINGQGIASGYVSADLGINYRLPF